MRVIVYEGLFNYYKNWQCIFFFFCEKQWSDQIPVTHLLGMLLVFKQSGTANSTSPTKYNATILELYNTLQMKSKYVFDKQQ